MNLELSVLKVKEDEDSVSSDQAYIGYRKDHPGGELGNTASNFLRPSYPKSESFSNVYKDHEPDA